ncbi:addiction module antidote protein, HigA family [Stenotrophomonas sp.]|uniref:addiction module antidote protein, HigA family n=1 Tax=Stenotrophomonas sp. TaxID=69392 RepID=UPI0028B0E305|nr:addiction module antidote protein, HigA family [Stenotrophomonas sp.]
MSTVITSPGAFIQSLIAERAWTNRAFALACSLEESECSRLISNKKPVTAKIAILLESVFSVPAEEFLVLQARHELHKERLKQVPHQPNNKRGLFLAELPISAMIKRGWLDVDSARDKIGIERELDLFFEVKEGEEIDPVPHAAKRTQVSDLATPAQLAWVYRVRRMAQDMIAPQYSPARGADLVEKLKLLRASPESVRHVPRLMTEHGIRFVIVETLPSAKIDGVCFWLSPTAPVIGMTLRFDRIDNFWFVLRHEIEHVLLGHGTAGAIIDSELDGEPGGLGTGVAEEERLANQAASEFLVPSVKLEAFVARKAPFFATRDIIGFANLLGVHPGLVAGPLQRRIGRYNLFREHLVKVRDAVLPSALVDGWGSVAPID